MELPLPIRQLQIPLLFLTNILTLSFKPSFLRTAISLPIFTLLLLQSLYQKDHVYYGVQYPMCCLVITLTFIYTDWILLSSPDKEIWHRTPLPQTKIIRNGEIVGWKDSNGKVTKHAFTPTLTVPTTFLARLWWATTLSTTTRYINWSQQVKNVPALFDHDYPRWLFFVRKIPRAILMYMIVDALQSYTASTPHGAYRTFENGKVPVGLEGESLARQVSMAWLHIVNTYANLEMANVVFALVMVALGMARPADCPSAFGDLKSMYTVRKSWAVVWHQNCRRICSAPSVFLVRDVLGLRKGSFASKYLQLFLGFFVSAVMHGGAAMLCHRSLDDDCAFAVFMAQAVAIMIEDHVIEFGKRIGLQESRFWRVVGYFWVVAWFGLSTIPYLSATLHSGLWIHDKTRDFFGLGPVFSNKE